MSKLQLPSVTLLCVDCVDIKRAIKILEHCKSKVDFGEVRLLTSIPTEYPNCRIMPLNSLIAYSVFMLTRVHEYVDTDHMLIVQRDGWILNPESFDMKWLENDYTAPLFVQYDHVGSGGFSLRTKFMMEEFADEIGFWDGSEEEARRMTKENGYYEDGIISFSKFGKRFFKGSLEQAAQFAQGGNRNPQYFKERPFGFHRTWQEIDFKTGRVDSSDTSKHLHVTYDHEIDTL